MIRGIEKRRIVDDLKDRDHLFRDWGFYLNSKESFRDFFFSPGDDSLGKSHSLMVFFSSNRLAQAGISGLRRIAI